MKSLTISFVILFLTTALAIPQNQWDNFQNGTNQGWVSGATNPNPPVVVLNGGPGGAGDAYLKVTSNGSQGAGGRLITYNSTHWDGNYTASGITTISMHLNNFGSQALKMRIVVQGPGGNFWSANPVNLPAQSGWQIAQFSLLPGNLTGGSNVNSTLSGVTELRILHSTAGANNGDIITTVLGIDNITAADQPLPVELTSFTVNQSGSTALLKWVTASEKNNHGFEIEKKISVSSEEGNWRLVGFRNGAGTTTEEKEYFFSDELSNISAEKISYRLKQIDFNGTYTYSSIVDLVIAPVSFSLNQNYPNPFNPETKIRFNLPSDEYVSLKVFNLLGKEVAELINEKKPAGSYELNFNADQLSSGVYYYQLIAGNYRDVKKMILLR